MAIKPTTDYLNQRVKKLESDVLRLKLLGALQVVILFVCLMIVIVFD